MNIHRPQRKSTAEGLGLPANVKQLRYLSPTRAILTEKWGEMPDGVWQQGESIIAEPGYVWESEWVAGRQYVVIKMYEESGWHIGTYVDISRPVERVQGGFAFDDLYLDVWQEYGEPPLLLDEDELAAAVKAKFVRPAEAKAAYEVARKMLAELAVQTG